MSDSYETGLRQFIQERLDAGDMPMDIYEKIVERGYSKRTARRAVDDIKSDLPKR